MNVVRAFLRPSFALLAVSLLPAAASAATVTFDTGPHTAFGGSFTGSVTESGYTYSTLSGSLFLSAFGNPGQTMEGNEEFGGGVLNIVSATSSTFTFSQLDFSAFGATSGSETITVTGILNGSIKGTDTYTLTDTSIGSPTYSNWTTELASNLVGLTLNDLQITLPADSTFHSANVDNVVLGPVVTAATPEPGSIVLLGTGLLGVLGTVRRRA